MMKSLRLIASLAAVLAASCGDDPAGLDFADLAGHYSATEVTLTSVSDPSQKYDLVADGGAAFDLTIESDGDYVLIDRFPGSSPETDSGRLEIRGNRMILNGGDTLEGIFTVTGTMLRLDIEEGVKFDFDENGTEDAATAVIVFGRT